MKLVEQVYFSDAKPENHNLRIGTMKDFRNGIIEKFGPQGWQCAMKNPVYCQLLVSACDLMQRVYDEWKWEGMLDTKLGKRADDVEALLAGADRLRSVQEADRSLSKTYTRRLDCLMMNKFKKTAV